MPEAHDSAVWSLDWHPLGHMLATGSNDYTARFWTRNRPGDTMQNRFDMRKDEAEAMGISLVIEQEVQGQNMNNQDASGQMMSIPGMGVKPEYSVPGLGTNGSIESRGMGSMRGYHADNSDRFLAFDSMLHFTF